MSLSADAHAIIDASIRAVLPDRAVRRALEGQAFPEGRLVLIAVGKAAWRMAKAAHDALGDRIDEGVVITKYGHVEGPIGNLALHEAGHPVPDARSFSATRSAIGLVRDLGAHDTVLLLLSGGGSALFEDPKVSPEELASITEELLGSGASITEINTIRKRLSNVKGGRFAQVCAPAHVRAIVLSDIIGDPLDMIASGPAYPDSTTCADAEAIARARHLHLSEDARRCLADETPKELDNVTTTVTGSVRELCRAAADAARELGYQPTVLSDCLCGEARELGGLLGAIARTHASDDERVAFICGGETVVHVTGSGLGGRNQEIALAAALAIEGLDNVCVLSVGSDGTDGPTDAAGGIALGDTVGTRLSAADARAYLADNDAYHALERAGALVKTGPTGTNVNDVAAVLVRPR